MSSTLTDADRARILQTYDALHQAEWQQYSAKVVFTKLSSFVGEHALLRLKSVVTMINDLLYRGLLSDATLARLKNETKAIMKELEQSPEAILADLPSDRAAALVTVLFVASREVEDALGAKVQRLSVDLDEMLRKFGISRSTILQEELNGLAQNPNLAVIDMTHQTLASRQLVKLRSIVQTKPMLTVVNLAYCVLGDEFCAHELLLPLGELQLLRCLSLAANALSNVTATKFIDLVQNTSSPAVYFPSLQSADFGLNEIDNDLLQAMDAAVADAIKKRCTVVEPHARTMRGAKYRVLSLDGCGLRGLVQLAALEAIQEASGKYPTDLFDLVVGTSSGAVVATALAQRMPLKRIRALLYDISQRCFASYAYMYYLQAAGRWLRSYFTGGDYYPSAELVAVFDETLAGSQPFSAAVSKKNVALLTTDCATGEPFLVRSYTTKSKFPVGDNKSVVPVHDVLRATTATRTYFAPQQVKVQSAHQRQGEAVTLADGGARFSNPSIVAYTEALLSHPPENIVVVSLGSGYDGSNGRGNNNTATNRLLVQKLSSSSAVAGATGIMQPAEPVHESMQRLASKSAYVRLNPRPENELQLDVGSIPGDECNPLVLDAVYRTGVDYVKTNKHLVLEAVSLLMRLEKV